MSIATEDTVIEDQVTKTASTILSMIERYKAFDTFDLSPGQRDEHYSRLSTLECLDEQDIVRIARRYAARKRTYPYDLKIAAIHRLRVNIKSLAAEARFIRHEERRCGIQYWYLMNQHRRVDLRLESRLAHLALAFLRGRNRREVDQLRENWDHGYELSVIGKKLHAKISRFYTTTQEDVVQWLRG